MSDLSEKRAIIVALYGSCFTKEMNPAVHYAPEEIAKGAYECWQAGHDVLAKSNAQHVERAVQLLRPNNLEPATPDGACLTA